MYISNTSTDSPQSNRWWVNMGGAQGGTIGFYQDQTSTRWVNIAGTGSSIAASQALPGGGFIDFSCDCDFGDIDNDGDIDLVHSTYGGDFGGQVPTRIFLNDGAGFFTEFNPSGFQLAGQLISNGSPGLWCEGTHTSNTTNSTGAQCDVASTALDIDVGDLDGDLDLDILHGARVEQPRIFQNRLEENGGTLGFRDVTGAVFPGGYSTGNGHYEQELGDFDADGDLDIYGLNWLQGGFTFNDCTLENNGSGTFFGLATMAGSGSDDNEADFIDYDLDGDMDVFVANFAGQDRMYQNSNGQGTMNLVPPPPGPGNVLPADGLIALDADSADVDNDGDPDIIVANDAGQSEWYLKNGTSANDVTAPVIYVVEQAPNRTPGPDPTVIRAQVEDNQPYYGTWYIPVRLDVTVNGGPVTSYAMRASLGQIFRGELPGSLTGTIAYKVVAVDQYGNTGQSGTLSYVVGGGPLMTSFCNPASGGTINCPCSNDPSGPDRGCDNFGANSGGASITATGTASLSGDTVVLTCSGENLTSLNVLFQAKDPIIPAGVLHSAGVRCASNTLKRLYSGNAAGGNFIRPGMGDASVSARSAALNDPIGAGQSRHYFSIYRDNLAIGPCGGNPAMNLNLTNAGTIVWAP
jgi:hypothetical protein